MFEYDFPCCDNPACYGDDCGYSEYEDQICYCPECTGRLPINEDDEEYDEEFYEDMEDN